MSSFERWLNRALWGLLLVALIGAALQHVFLANVPEVFPTGARWGELFYDLAIGYVGAFVFYLIVVRVPLRRDRENYYRHLGFLVVRLVAEASDLMMSLNRAAKFDTARPHTLVNLREMLGQLRPNTEAEHMLATPSGNVPGKVMDVVAFHVERARIMCREILGFAPYYDSEVVEVVAAIEICPFFQMFNAVEPQLRTSTLGEKLEMSFFEEAIFDYLQLADRLHRYRQKNRDILPDNPEPFPELIQNTGRDSDASPLGGEIPRAGMRVMLGDKTFDTNRSWPRGRDRAATVSIVTARSRPATPPRRRRGTSCGRAVSGSLCRRARRALGESLKNPAPRTATHPCPRRLTGSEEPLRLRGSCHAVRSRVTTPSGEYTSVENRPSVLATI